MRGQIVANYGRLAFERTLWSDRVTKATPVELTNVIEKAHNYFEVCERFACPLFVQIKMRS